MYLSSKSIPMTSIIIFFFFFYVFNFLIFYLSSSVSFFKIYTYDFNHYLLFFVPRFKFGYHLYTLLPYIVYTFSSASSIKPVGVSIMLYSKKRQSSSIPPNSSLSISV